MDLRASKNINNSIKRLYYIIKETMRYIIDTNAAKKTTHKFPNIKHMSAFTEFKAILCPFMIVILISSVILSIILVQNYIYSINPSSSVQLY